MMTKRQIEKPLRGVWTSVPAEKWQEGFVAGNGNIGAILFGTNGQFTLIGNHHRLFLKENDMYHLPDIAEYLPHLREIIRKEGYEEGIRFFEEKAIEKGYKGLTMSDLYHPAFQLSFQIEEMKKEKHTYFRSLDYAKGLITEKEGNLKRELFVSKEKNVIGFSIQADKPFDARITLEDFQHSSLKQTSRITNNSIVQYNKYNDKSGYTTEISWEIRSGTKQVAEDGILLQQVKQINFLIEVFLSEKEKEAFSDFDTIKREHILAHEERYHEVELNIVNNDERLRSIDHIFEEMEETGSVPLVLYEKMYDASRYVLHAATGKALPNLQGIWSGDFTPAWSGDYTFDTNVELAISSLNSLGMSQNLEGFFKRIKEYESDFEENAQKYFGCRGFLVPVHASTTAKHVHWNKEWPLIFWLSGAGWLAHFYQEYVDYTQDETFLAEVAIPFYEKTILFYEDFVQLKDNQILIQPSYSAENGMGDNSTMDAAVLKEVLTNLIKGYERLNLPVSESFIDFYQRIPDYAVNEEGVLKEWIDPKKEENYNHRHFSQFYPVFQSKEINKENKLLWRAAQKGFDKKIAAWLMNEEAGNSSSHGRMHAAMCAISLERPRDLEAAVDEMLLNCAMYPSLVTSHYNQQEVFNVDANGALPKIYHDALLYPENDKEVTLFKAVPKWLEKGAISGIALPGSVRVNKFEWDMEKGKGFLDLVSYKDWALTLKVDQPYTVNGENEKGGNRLTVDLEKNIQKRVFISRG